MRRARTVTVDVTERLRLMAEHDGITVAEATRQALAFWLDTREQSIAEGESSLLNPEHGGKVRESRADFVARIKAEQAAEIAAMAARGHLDEED